MKLSPSLLLLASLLGAFAPSYSRAQTLDKMPPVVVKTFPQAGAKDVAPGDLEIRITFSKDMRDGWSFSPLIGEKSDYVVVTEPRFEKDHRTFVIKLHVKPNQAYAYFVNTEKFRGFRDRAGITAVPYTLYFQTKEN